MCWYQAFCSAKCCRRSCEHDAIVSTWCAQLGVNGACFSSKTLNCGFCLENARASTSHSPFSECGCECERHFAHCCHLWLSPQNIPPPFLGQSIEVVLCVTGHVCDMRQWFSKNSCLHILWRDTTDLVFGVQHHRVQKNVIDFALRSKSLICALQRWLHQWLEPKRFPWCGGMHKRSKFTTTGCVEGWWCAWASCISVFGPAWLIPLLLGPTWSV